MTVQAYPIGWLLLYPLDPLSLTLLPAGEWVEIAVIYYVQCRFLWKVKYLSAVPCMSVASVTCLQHWFFISHHYCSYYYITTTIYSLIIYSITEWTWCGRLLVVNLTTSQWRDTKSFGFSPNSAHGSATSLSVSESINCSFYCCFCLCYCVYIMHTSSLCNK